MLDELGLRHTRVRLDVGARPSLDETVVDVALHDAAWQVVLGLVRTTALIMFEDTSRAGLRRYNELLRAQQPFERIAQAAALTRAVRELAEAGIRQRYPDAAEEEVRIRLTVRLYGRDTALRLFGDAVPEDAV